MLHAIEEERPNVVILNSIGVPQLPLSLNIRIFGFTVCSSKWRAEVAERSFFGSPKSSVASSEISSHRGSPFGWNLKESFRCVIKPKKTCLDEKKSYMQFLMKKFKSLEKFVKSWSLNGLECLSKFSLEKLLVNRSFINRYNSI